MIAGPELNKRYAGILGQADLEPQTWETDGPPLVRRVQYRHHPALSILVPGIAGSAKPNGNRYCDP
jgi:hypothetical protein